MKHLIIIGARGFAREAYHMALRTKDYQNGVYDIKGFLDDKSDCFHGLKGDFPPILGPVETYEIQTDDVFFCALGDNFYRKKYSEMIENKGGEFISLISPLAIVNPSATIGSGSYISGFTLISDNVIIGKHVIVQIFSDFGHDSKVGDYTSIGAYVFLGGGAKIGKMVTMHTKSTVLPCKTVGDNCVVGVASTVMRNFKSNCSLFGTPAKIFDL